MALPRVMFVKVDGAADNTSDSYLTWDTTNPHADDLPPGDYEIMSMRPPSDSTWLPLTVAAASGSISPSSGSVGTTFTVTHNGGSSTTLQWELDGTPIGGATASTYEAEGAGELTCVITASAANIGETDAVTVTEGAGVHDQIVNLGSASGTRGLYLTGTTGFETTTPADGHKMWLEYIAWYDGSTQPGTTEVAISLGNPSDTNKAFSGTGQTLRLYMVASTISTTAATMTGSARWYIGTVCLTKLTSSTDLRFWRENVLIDTENTPDDVNTTWLAGVTRLGFGYRPTSTPSLHAPFRVAYGAWGTGDPAARHTAIWNGGAYVDPMTVDDNGATVLGAQQFTRETAGAFNLASDFPDLSAQGTGHAWISIPATLPWQD